MFNNTEPTSKCEETVEEIEQQTGVSVDENKTEEVLLSEESAVLE